YGEVAAPRDRATAPLSIFPRRGDPVAWIPNRAARFPRGLTGMGRRRRPSILGWYRPRCGPSAAPVAGCVPPDGHLDRTPIPLFLRRLHTPSCFRGEKV